MNLRLILCALQGCNFGPWRNDASYRRCVRCGRWEGVMRT